jgi:hypothetical protein
MKRGGSPALGLAAQGFAVPRHDPMRVQQLCLGNGLADPDRLAEPKLGRAPDSRPSFAHASTLGIAGALRIMEIISPF